MIAALPCYYSLLNDIVLDEVNGYAYFTNTWGSGGIVVFNINKNESHMFQSLFTCRNSSYDFCCNGICYGTNGIGSSPSDGIALSSDGKVLFWSSVQGRDFVVVVIIFIYNPPPVFLSLVL